MGKVASFIIGLAAGAALGLLLAPEKGEVLRRRIREEADRLIDEALELNKNQERKEELRSVVEQINVQ